MSVDVTSTAWIFGYGSLIWRPAVAFVERRVGYIEGFERRFWQLSTDHRGVPGSPGRVATLVERPGSQCWGVAYRLDPEQAVAMMTRLDHREQGGYSRIGVRVHATPSVDALVYVGTHTNPQFAGPAPLAAIAEQIHRSHGPSGPNREYLLRLHEALRAMGAVDEHVITLANLVQELEAGPS